METHKTQITEMGGTMGVLNLNFSLFDRQEIKEGSSFHIVLFQGIPKF